jgi:hypothetical protein
VSPNTLVWISPWFPALTQALRGLLTLYLARTEQFYMFLQPLIILTNVCFFYLLLSTVRSAYHSSLDVLPKAEQIGPVAPGVPNASLDASSVVATIPSVTEQSIDFAVHVRIANAISTRSHQAAESARISMIIMIVLVLVGGGASVGLWFFGQLDRIRAIEVERNRLLQLSVGIQRLPRLAAADQVQAVKDMQKVIQDNYDAPNDYRVFLKDIADKLQTSWPDIAIRVTLAVLTLFLVQIFFAVYKYNQHLSNLLAAKAEALELLAVTPEDRQRVRSEMIPLATESLPGFAAGPQTPLQDILNVIGKAQKAKPE